MRPKHKYFIDTNKGLNAIVVLALMAWYGAWDNVTLWIYLALHGTYGLLWVAKSRWFGDRQWEKEVSWGYGLMTFFALSAYWVGPWLLASGRVPPAPGWYAALAISGYAIGVFFHFTSDMQKRVALTLRPGVLITDGMFAVCRNPNYLGELLIYLGFTMLPRHPAPLAVLAVVVLGVWAPLIRQKERSMSRYPEWAAYAARTKLIIPGVL